MRATGNKIAALLTCSGPYLTDGAVVTIAVLVENVCMSVGERTTLDVLTGETDVVAFMDKSCKSKSLSGTPVNTILLDN